MGKNSKKDVVIEVKNISKTFNLYNTPADRVKEALDIRKKSYHKSFIALKNIDFNVLRGETVGIIGSNGAGKSTLLKIITGVIAPTSGSVYVDGRISALLELGTGFNPEYTGIENIELNGKMLGFSKKEMEKRIEKIRRFADIGDYIFQPVKNYSSGMFARLAFAVAISIEPEILIIDEALSVGDVFFQNKCYQKFDELKEMGTSILFVSHDISTVRKMCSRVLWIEQGKQLRFGDSNAVCNSYFDSQLVKINRANDEAFDKMILEMQDKNCATVYDKYPEIMIAENSILNDNVRIISAFVKKEDDYRVKLLKPGEKYIAGVVVEFETNMDGVIVGVSFDNIKGITMFSFNTFIAFNKGLSFKKGDTIEFDFSFKCPFVRSGSYEMSPAVGIGTQKNHSILTWLHGVVGIDIDSYGYEIAEIGVESIVNFQKI